MKIVHASDWHGKFVDLPPADVYVFSGDMNRNFFPLRILTGKGWKETIVTIDPAADELAIEPVGVGGPFPSDARVIGYISDASREAEREKVWMDKVLGKGSWRAHLGSPNAPVILVRGNHDYVSCAELFDGGPVHDLSDGDSVSINDVLFSGLAGVPPINGEWWGEKTEETLDLEIRRLNDRTYVLVTHAPPFGVMDSYGRLSFGSLSFKRHLDRVLYEPLCLKAWLFGHVHNAHGIQKIGDPPVLMSNAATVFHVLEV